MIRREERRTAREYDAWLRSGRLSAIAMRALMGPAGIYLLNTPVLRLAEEVGLDSGHRVLDVGCGEGNVAAELARQAGLVHEPVGVDLSLATLKRAASGRRPPVQFVAAAATRLPFADESFHLATCAYVLKHLEDESLLPFLAEVHRLLKPGGILLAWEFAPTGSARLDRFHRWLLTRGVKTCNLRSFGDLAPYALYAGFHHVDLKLFPLPFIFPPIPRVGVMLQKARANPHPAISR